MRIAVVGGGGAGLCCARLLEDAGHDVVLFERSERLGGHVHTLDVGLPSGATITVEAGMRVTLGSGLTLRHQDLRLSGIELRNDSM